MSLSVAEIRLFEGRLMSAAAHLQGAEALSLPQALAVLRSAHGRWLLAFDVLNRVRFRYVDAPPNTPPRTEHRVVNEDEFMEALLFVQACDPSGFSRERALRALRRYPGRLACAAALIRIEDWVDEVTGAAVELVAELARKDTSHHFVEFLDLIEGLRVKARFQPFWTSLIEPLLLDPRWRAARRQAAGHSDADIRQFALSLRLRADSHEARGILEQGIADASPRNVRWAISELAVLDHAAQLELLRVAMRHRLGGVRADSLRAYLRLGTGDRHEILVLALLDRSNAVRTAAAWHLEQDHGQAALEHWRAAFDAGRERAMLTQVLAERGDASDEARLRSQLGHTRGRVRAAALRGLWRIGAADRETLLRQGLSDASAQVVSEALKGFSHSDVRIDAAVLRDSLAQASTAAPRARLIAGVELLPKWERLEQVLAMYRDCLSTERHLLDAQIRSWVHNYNRSYAPLDELRRQRLTRLLEALHDDMGSMRVAGLKALL